MARYRAAVCKLCRREGEKLFLKGSRCQTAKCAIEKSFKKDLTNFVKCDKSGTFMAFIKFYKF